MVNGKTVKYLRQERPDYEMWRSPGSEKLAVESQRRYNAWMERNMVVKSVRSRGEWTNMIGGKFRCSFDYGTLVDAKFFDHCALYEDVHGGRIYVSQPYRDGRMTDEENMAADRVAEWADERGLSVRGSSDDSWHNPGLTILLEFRLADPDRYMDYIKAHRQRTMYPGCYSLK